MASELLESKDSKSKLDPQVDDDMKMDPEEALDLNIISHAELWKAMGVDPISIHRNQRTSIIVPTQHKHFEFKIEAASETTPTASDTPSQTVSNNNLTAPILRRRSRKYVLLCFYYSFSYIYVYIHQARSGKI